MDNDLQKLFQSVTGCAPRSVRRLSQAGSNRIYYRLECEGRSLVGVKGTSEAENKAFFALDRHFLHKGLPVPELLAISDDGMSYLQQDLGDTLLFDVLCDARTDDGFSSSAMDLLEQVLTILPDFQFKGAQGLDFSICHPIESFDRRGVMWDLNYFKYCFLKTAAIEFDENRLEDDFETLASSLDVDGGSYETFMYRDFQSRNVMVCDGKPWFIDFQGGRRGPIQYDVVSFLWQARAAYPMALKRHLLDVYLDALSRYRKVSRATFMEKMRHFVLFRTLQVLGAYGFRGFTEHKAHFLQSIPAAMANVRELLSEGLPGYPYLEQLLYGMASEDRFSLPMTDDGGLTVRITSFSYRKGMPQDLSGNGGGFVFDCRAMHNPGRYEEYQNLTGLDAPVIEFLEERGEVQKFLENVYSLTISSVDRYLQRGFTSLSVSFGCTGGQHRSVYCAQHTAEFLRRRYGNRVNVVLVHRELDSNREEA